MACPRPRTGMAPFATEWRDPGRGPRRRQSRPRMPPTSVTSPRDLRPVSVGPKFGPANRGLARSKRTPPCLTPGDVIGRKNPQSRRVGFFLKKDRTLRKAGIVSGLSFFLPAGFRPRALANGNHETIPAGGFSPLRGAFALIQDNPIDNALPLWEAGGFCDPRFSHGRMRP